MVKLGEMTFASRRAIAGFGAAMLVGLAAGMTTPSAFATPVDDAYLAAIEAESVPILGRDYVVALGHAICDTAVQNPAMQLADLVLSVVGNENKPSPYTFEQGMVIARAALGNYCAGAAGSRGDGAPAVVPPVVAPVPGPAGYPPSVPDVADAPRLNLGCTWVNGYTKKNGTRVRGHYRC